MNDSILLLKTRQELVAAVNALRYASAFVDRQPVKAMVMAAIARSDDFLISTFKAPTERVIITETSNDIQTA